MHGPVENPPIVGAIMHSCGAGARRGYLVVGCRLIRLDALGAGHWRVTVESRSIERAKAEIAQGAPAWPFDWDKRKPGRRN